MATAGIFTRTSKVDGFTSIQLHIALLPAPYFLTGKREYFQFDMPNGVPIMFRNSAKPPPVEVIAVTV
jgi:hypothetical protein